MRYRLDIWYTTDHRVKVIFGNRLYFFFKLGLVTFRWLEWNSFLHRNIICEWCLDRFNRGMNMRTGVSITSFVVILRGRHPKILVQWSTLCDNVNPSCIHSTHVIIAQCWRNYLSRIYSSCTSEFMPVMPRLIVIPDEDHKVSPYSTVGLRHQTASAPANSRKVVELQIMKGTSPFTSFFNPQVCIFLFTIWEHFIKTLLLLVFLLMKW